MDNIIFDLDGTLLDTTEGVLESAIYAAKKMGFEELDHSIMLKFIGPPIQNSFIEHYQCDKEVAQQAAEIFRDYYKSKALFKAKAYDGIYDVLENLKKSNKKMAVATYKREDYAIDILKYFQMDKYFDVMHGADNANILKKSDIVQMCIQELSGNVKQTVLIGDTLNDAIGAQQANVSFLAVTYGFGFKEGENDCEYPHIARVNSPIEILEHV